MTTIRILTEDGDLLTTEDGDYIHTEASDGSSAQSSIGKARTRFKPSTFWQKYYYFYGRKEKRSKRR